MNILQVFGTVDLPFVRSVGVLSSIQPSQSESVSQIGENKPHVHISECPAGNILLDLSLHCEQLVSFDSTRHGNLRIVDENETQADGGCWISPSIMIRGGRAGFPRLPSHFCSLQHHQGDHRSASLGSLFGTLKQGTTVMWGRCRDIS